MAKGLHKVDDELLLEFNNSILWLYQLAFGKFDMDYLDPGRLILKGFTYADSVKIGYPGSNKMMEDWRKNIDRYSYNYEVATADSIFSNQQLFDIMAEDINRYFQTEGLKGNLELKNQKVLALVLIDSTKKSNFVGGVLPGNKMSTQDYIAIRNQPMAVFLNAVADHKKKIIAAPIVNETGYVDVVNMELDTRNLSLVSLNKQMYNYGLKFIERATPVKMIVITKR